MKTWKIGAVIGGIWGLISYVIMWIMSWDVDLTTITLLFKIAFLPTYIFLARNFIILPLIYLMMLFNQFLPIAGFFLFPLFSVLIGSLIGSIVSIVLRIAIEKFRRGGKK